MTDRYIYANREDWALQEARDILVEKPEHYEEDIKDALHEAYQRGLKASPSMESLNKLLGLQAYMSSIGAKDVPCHCGSGAHPRKCDRHPWAFDAHVLELNYENLKDVAQENERLQDENMRLRLIELRVLRYRDDTKVHHEAIRAWEEASTHESKDAALDVVSSSCDACIESTNQLLLAVGYEQPKESDHD